ncbi:hypothetical protein FIU87_05100 [Bacillus sp. THAF10]|nr:hypothetical protein FIU87_05100 [Bacillus sp. THAF10]
MYLVIPIAASLRDWMVGENPGRMKDEVQYTVKAIETDE